MGEYKTLADIPYEVLLERAALILCKQLYLHEDKLEEIVMYLCEQIYPYNPYQFKLQIMDVAANELTGVKKENESESYII